MYFLAFVYWMFFRVRDDTRVWLRIIMCSFRVCRGERESVRVRGRVGVRRLGYFLFVISFIFFFFFVLMFMFYFKY